MSEISIIIPVYNTRSYLIECLDSVIAQTFNNIEIILVDDGSNDGSEKIVDEYALRDERIKVIHQKNQGLSAARNTGIKASKSPYIMFVDSDDYVDEKYCETPYSIIKQHNADIVSFEFRHHQEEER